MTATGHAIIGTVIAAKFANPMLAIPLAILSHVIADTIPHWDMATSGKEKGKQKVLRDAALDVVAGFLISFLIIYFLFPYVDLAYAFVIIIAAQSLDWVMAPYYFWKIKFPLFVWAYKFQKKIEHRLSKPWGVINQLLILILLVALAKLL
ncbi:MAG: hypothetical protein WD967_01220 [Candidatus Levyibacteriota bacterium]